MADSTQPNVQALNLPNGTLIVTKSKKRFTIVDTLQKSLHRAVYVASLPNTEGKFVIKAEAPTSATNAKNEKRILKEMILANALGCATPMETERFADFVEYGESKLLNFVIWKRLGPSLDELHQMYHQKFSLATATRINLQTLRAISKLHALGFVHRNIQPAHFVVGEVAKRVVYIISFTLSRVINSASVDPQRSPFKLELKQQPPTTTSDPQALPDAKMTAARESSASQQYFAARYWYTSDAGTSLSRVDDIESWFYMSMHFIDPESIPWMKVPIQMLTDIFEIKRDLFLHVYSEEIFFKSKQIPLEYRRFIDEINASLSNYAPDYEKLISIATKVAQAACPNSNSPYDWEELPAPLLSDYGEFRVPAPSQAVMPQTLKKTTSTTTSKAAAAASNNDDPEMDKLLENWQNNFRKLILAGVPRAQAYQRVMGISHPPELATGHWKAIKPKKKKKKTTVEKVESQEHA